MPFNSNQKEIAAVCGDDMVRIINWNESEGDVYELIWSWNIKEAYSHLPPEYENYLYPLDECKFASDNKQLLITASAGAVLLLDIATRQCLFHAYAPLAHSAEILPQNRLAVVLSTHKDGNCIRLYDLNQPDRILYKDRLYFGHAVIWDMDSETLYALGFSKLKSYKLGNWDSDTPTLLRIKTWTLHMNAGHDMCFIDTGELLIAGREGVYSFRIEEEQFYPFPPLAETGGLKSINYDLTTQSLIYTKGEEKWWTHRVYEDMPFKYIEMKDMRIYKVRLPE